ncbi:RNA-directed DNA polymerase, eukaryota [Tanacetum coccineum]
MHGKDKPSNSNETVDPNKSEDPFEICKILKKKKESEVTKSDEPQFPPGFTPKVVELQFPPGFTPEVVEENVMEINPDDVVEDNVKEIGFEKNSKSKNSVVNNNERFSSGHIGSSFASKFKTSGSILDVMDEFITVGQTMGYNMEGCMKNIESIIGDFNEVCSEHERHGTVFHLNGANVFNNFIIMAVLVDLPLEGYSFTWSYKSASKMSKLDRFLITEVKDDKLKSNAINMFILSRLTDLDKIIDQGNCNKEFLKHFSNRFAAPLTPKLSFQSQFPNRVTPEQIDVLESIASYDEIKRAVWDCGINKSPGPDGFSFEFFRKY